VEDNCLLSFYGSIVEVFHRGNSDSELFPQAMSLHVTGSDSDDGVHNRGSGMTSRKLITLGQRTRSCHRGVWKVLNLIFDYSTHSSLKKQHTLEASLIPCLPPSRVSQSVSPTRSDHIPTNFSLSFFTFFSTTKHGNRPRMNPG
jgi:hypothetical protein